MMTTADVRDWLKTLTDAEHFYVGKLDNKPDKAIGVYTLTERGHSLVAVLDQLCTWGLENKPKTQESLSEE